MRKSLPPLIALLLVLILMTFDLPLLIFSRVLGDAAANPVVLLCICLWLCEKKGQVIGQV